MSVDVRVLTTALADLAEAREWYEEREVGLGSDFLEVFYAALDDLSRNPESHPRVFREFRRLLLLPRFPFGAYYRVQDSVIFIVRIYHCARDPGELRTSLRGLR